MNTNRYFPSSRLYTIIMAINTSTKGLIEDFLNKCREGEKPPLLVILGPTASGKTALSLELAREFNGEIVSADSRQIYRGMDIGTDKISETARGGIPHHLIDVANPDERFTVANFKKLAEEKIDGIYGRGKLPMLVGGTGLYIRAITENFSIPPENPELRGGLYKELKRYGAEALHKKLQEVDPENAAKISPKNIPYIVRALEIFHITGKPKSAQKNPPKYRCLLLGMRRDLPILFERIHRRIDAQIESGLIEETQKLLAAGYSKNLGAMNSLGYQEIIEYLEGKISLDAARELLKKNTRNFAKRQMTWFKKDKGIVWT